jgi:hypothetical protein
LYASPRNLYSFFLVFLGILHFSVYIFCNGRWPVIKKINISRILLL